MSLIGSLLSNSGGGGGGTVNLSITNQTEDSLDIAPSGGGTSATLPAASGDGNAGIMSNNQYFYLFLLVNYSNVYVADQSARFALASDTTLIDAVIGAYGVLGVVESSPVHVTQVDTGVTYQLYDFSNIGNADGYRVSGTYREFQNPTNNQNTIVSALPSGTGTIGAYRIYNSSNKSNSSILDIYANPAGIGITSYTSGSGPLLPIQFMMNNNPCFTLNTDYTATFVGNISAPNLNGDNIITESTTTRTLSLTDAFKYIRATNSSETIITIPNNSTVPFTIGTEINIWRQGSGTVTFGVALGVTVNSSTSSISTQHKSALLKKVGTNEWDIII